MVGGGECSGVGTVYARTTATTTGTYTTTVTTITSIGRVGAGGLRHTGSAPTGAAGHCEVITSAGIIVVIVVIAIVEVPLGRPPVHLLIDVVKVEGRIRNVNCT